MDSLNKVEIRFVKTDDKDFWFSLDNHLTLAEFNKKVRDNQGYVLFAENQPVGILRYNLFWDNMPFCTLLYIKNSHRGIGYGKKLMNFWENQMKSSGYNWLLVSTQSNESAQHFYRALGYKDCGYLNAPNQPPELFLSKLLK